MPWPEDHKARTRERIVHAAAAAVRAGGVAGVRVEDVMARAGLTHGGFYAHFPSKDDLLREAVEHASSQTVEALSAPLATLRGEDRLQAVADAYLSAAHAAHPEKGCPLAALGPEIARSSGPPHDALAEAARARIAWMGDLVPRGRRDTTSDAQVIGTLACMVGGVILARTVGGEDAGAVLGACREFLRAKPARATSRRRTRRSPRTAPSRKRHSRTARRNTGR